MTARAIFFSKRRGACPGLSAPMPTGDGLLVRFLPTGTISLAAFAGLRAAAQRYGNGMVEVTARGSIQIRGLTPATAPRFADAIAALNIAGSEGVPVHTDALASLDPAEVLDAGAIANDLRGALALRGLTATLAPKVSVVIDGGRAISFADLSADVRMRAVKSVDGVRIRLGIAGSGASAAQLGFVAPQSAVEAAIRLLEVIARRGRKARARDVLAAEGIAVFRSAVVSLLEEPAPSDSCAGDRKTEIIGLHELRNGTLACGIGLAFGHTDAATLKCLAEAAATSGASGIRAAPDRALLVIGLTRATANDFVAAAEKLGFIVNAEDSRRNVIACAGAPICSSAHLAARAIAPLIARRVAHRLSPSFQIHVSGCAKGCAHAGPAALTIVGSPNVCSLIANGSVHDSPMEVVAMDEILPAIAKYAYAMHEGDHV